MIIRLYQIDAFTDHVFGGNPAAVCPLNEWIDENLMQKIANENNLAETAFYINRNNEYHIRWFTPKVEVDLAGHPTLASAYVIFNEEKYDRDEIIFISQKSGELRVRREKEMFVLNFPTDELNQVEISETLWSGFGQVPVEAYKGKTDFLLVFESEAILQSLQPDMRTIGKLDARGIICTAPGEKSDFVSRFFAPQSGIDEDPVTGSAHTSLTPYWSKKLDKSELYGIQLSERRGDIWCKFLGQRVEIKGNAVPFMKGEIHI